MKNILTLIIIIVLIILGYSYFTRSSEPVEVPNDSIEMTEENTSEDINVDNNIDISTEELFFDDEPMVLETEGEIIVD